MAQCWCSIVAPCLVNVDTSGRKFILSLSVFGCFVSEHKYKIQPFQSFSVVFFRRFHHRSLLLSATHNNTLRAWCVHLCFLKKLFMSLQHLSWMRFWRYIPHCINSSSKPLSLKQMWLNYLFRIKYQKKLSLFSSCSQNVLKLKVVFKNSLIFLFICMNNLLPTRVSPSCFLCKS